MDNHLATTVGITDLMSTKAAAASDIPCLFTEMLPPEIRQEIYRHLLASRYLKREINMKSKEVGEIKFNVFFMLIQFIV